jgi:hypothetical protein
MVVEVGDTEKLTGAALDHIARDQPVPTEERAHAESAVREDDAEALAHLVDPFDLVSQVPGVELAQASWSSETTDFDPDAEDWAAGEDGDEAYYGIEDNETNDEEGGGNTER